MSNKKYISLLRGINVSGTKKIKMADLKNLYESLDYENITTYIQTGNVLFESSEKKQLVIAEQIKAKILDVYGFDVAVLVKTLKEFKSAVTENPFLKRGEEDIKKLHLTFLAEKPKKEMLASLEGILHKADEYEIIGKNIFLFCPDGYGRTKFTNTFFERKLKVQATTRNWNTIRKLVELGNLK